MLYVKGYSCVNYVFMNVYMIFVNGFFDLEEIFFL